jgi:hypothetical protein
MRKAPDTHTKKHYDQEHRRGLALVARELRMEHGMTEGELATRSKVSLVWVRKLEADQLNENYRLLHLFRFSLLWV